MLLLLLQAFFDDALDRSVSQLNFKAIVDGLGEVLFQYPFQVPAYYALILRSLTVLEGLVSQQRGSVLTGGSMGGVKVTPFYY